MNIWENAVTTIKGLSLLSKLMEGDTLQITRAETGKGYVTPGVLSQQTSVTEPVQALSIRPVIYPEEGTCKLPCYLTNEGLASGYTARQVGLYVTDPDEGEILFLIVQASSDTGTVIPSEAEMPGYSAEWTLYFEFGQADAVEVTVDPSNTVSLSEVESIILAHEKDRVIDVTSSDGITYTGTANGITELYEGLEITIRPDTTNTSNAMVLDINGLGAKPIKRPLSFSTYVNDAAKEGFLHKDAPCRLMYHATYPNRVNDVAGKGIWLMAEKQKTSAQDLYGDVPVDGGGTGASDIVEAVSNLTSEKVLIVKDGAQLKGTISNKTVIFAFENADAIPDNNVNFQNCTILGNGCKLSFPITQSIEFEFEHCSILNLSFDTDGDTVTEVYHSVDFAQCRIFGGSHTGNQYSVMGYTGCHVENVSCEWTSPCNVMIGDSAFEGCTLTGDYEIGLSLKNAMFSGCNFADYDGGVFPTTLYGTFYLNGCRGGVTLASTATAKPAPVGDINNHNFFTTVNTAG